MAFDLTEYGGYGTGSLGDVTDPTGLINTVAICNLYNDESLVAIDSIPVDGDFSGIINNPIDEQAFYDSSLAYGEGSAKLGISELKIKVVANSVFGGLAVGDEMLFQLAGISAPTNESIGMFAVANVVAVGSTDSDGWQNIIVDKPLLQFQAFKKSFQDRANLLCVTIPHFKNLTLNSGCSLSPKACDFGVNVTLVDGGILAFKCSESLTLNGGHIDLRNKGLPTNAADLAALLPQENQAPLDTDDCAGWENSATRKSLKLNAGDGTAFIMAKKLVVANDASRIGNPTTQGVQYCRGASDSHNPPDGVTNIGGSTILIAADTIQKFSPKIIAKYRDSSAEQGRGLARCYIASNTKLRNDEGLYAYDCISNPNRPADSLNIHTYGDGGSGSASTNTLFNNYATVTATDGSRKVLTVANVTTNGTEAFRVGATVMVHFNHKSSQGTANAGRFHFAKIVGFVDDTITLDTAIFNNIPLESYSCQLITVPQFTNFTLNTTHDKTPKYDGNQGGIFAIAVQQVCNLTGGIINVEGKGGGKPYGLAGLNQIGNAQDNDRLPIGTGHGSVFILAKRLRMDSSTRIGATYSGATYSGYKGKTGRYQILDANNADKTSSYSTIVNPAPGGSGAEGGSLYVDGDSEDANQETHGGYGGNGKANFSDGDMGKQGAHVMIIADTIEGFNQAAISTGGQCGSRSDYLALGSAELGSGAGYGGSGGSRYIPGVNTTGSAHRNVHAYGGGGGYNGGGAGAIAINPYQTSTRLAYEGGGSAGWAFIYCNQHS